MTDIINFLGSLWPALLRNVSGWVTNSLEDGKIQDYEWKQLLTTVIRVTMISAGLYFGWNGFSEVQVDGISAGFAALVFDYLISAFKKK